MQKEIKIKLTDNNANHYPYYYLTGHGNIKFTNNEIISLREILSNGVIRYDLLKNIIFLNVVYLMGAIIFFLKIIAVSRKKGLLINQGE